MSVSKITQRTAAALLPGQTVWDLTLKGFGIRRQRQAAVYILKYRQDGQQRFKTIGRHGSPWTAEMAREKAKVYLLGLIEGRGVDGSGNSGSLSFAQFAERYMTEHAAGRKKPRTLDEDLRNLDRHILPSLGALRLDQLTKRDIAAFHTRHRRHPVNANRCLSLISHIFTVAEKWDLLPAGSNPCRGLDRYPERRRERLLDDDEIRRLGAALDRCEQGQVIDWRAIACIRLLILTGARLSEVLGMQWSWINWERGFARLPDSKTGSKTIPLPAPALELLAALQRRAHDQVGHKHILPASRGDGYFKAIQKPWQLIRTQAGLLDARIHDLRHCYASVAVAGGESLYIVGAILGHRSTATTQRYAHLALEPVALAAGRTAGRLADLLTSPAPGLEGQISLRHAIPHVDSHHLGRLQAGTPAALAVVQPASAVEGAE